MIDLGDSQHLTLTVLDAAGNPANAGAVTVTVTLPDNSTASPATSSTGTGQYAADFVTSQAGRHRVRWVATGANAQTYSDVFEVAPADPQMLIGLEQARRAIGLAPTNTAKDDDLRNYLQAATPIMEDLIGSIVSTPRDEWLDGGSSWVRLSYAPVLAVTQVQESYAAGTLRTLTDQPLNGTGFDSYGYTVDLVDGLLVRRVAGAVGAFPRGRRNVHVTYTSGRAALQGNHILAARRLVRHLWQQEQLGFRPDMGAAENPTAYTPSGYAVPKAVIELCADSLRIPGIA